MYYITNHKDQIIAADESLLHSLHIQDLDDLIKNILLEEISFNKNLTNELQIVTSSHTSSYSISSVRLPSILGDLNLIHLTPQEELSEEININPDTLNLNEGLVSNTTQEEPLSLDLKEESTNDDIVNHEKLFDLTPSEISSEDTSPIIINIQEVSTDIGISNEDYKTFLNDYIDTAISLEEELQSEDEKERLSAVGTLTQLADVLQLPKVNTIIEQIPMAQSNELSNVVESFYQTLSRLTTKEESFENDTTNVSDEALLDTTKVEEGFSEKATIPNTFGQGFGKIYLEDIKPIHFDFQLESAANDLSLPVELIEEFVHDFIEQGHIETKKMLQAYEEGDLDTIQKIGHLLKGASSNLRINTLSDTLYDIQFCDDPDKLEDLIERYWAHFISFEQHIDMISEQ
ncbi:MAG: hypothetical protein L3J43_02820 [Sulfurovum sp.]|nr:hypothetical protein [Sulfurovum sp.]